LEKMSKYRVRLNRQNFLLILDDSLKKYGFYATRDVEAKSFEDARLKAVDMIRNETELVESTRNQLNDSPSLFVDEIRLLADDEEILKNSGYSFYIE
jgi:hypothetical protein